MEGNTPASAATTAPATFNLFERSFWRRTWIVVWVITLALLVAFVFYNGGGTVYSVIMAWFIALAMEPAVKRFSKRMSRGAATGLVMLLLAVFVIVFIALFGNLFVSQLVQLITAVPDMADTALKFINEKTESSYTYTSLLDSMGIGTDDLAAYASTVASGILSVLSSLVSGLFGAFVLVFFVFYISASMPKLREWLARRISPTAQIPFLTAWDLSQVKVGGYIAARVFLAGLNAGFSAIVFALVDLPYWLPLALWTGIIAQFIPNVGTYISIALPVIVGLTSPDPLIGIYVLIWAVAYQQVENIFIEPRISARAVNLHPAVSFAAALLGAQLFGISGALLGVPVAATIMAMLEIYKKRYPLSDETQAAVAALVSNDGTTGADIRKVNEDIAEDGVLDQKTPSSPA